MNNQTKIAANVKPIAKFCDSHHQFPRKIWVKRAEGAKRNRHSAVGGRLRKGRCPFYVFFQLGSDPQSSF
jgi:hypothetical protein